MYIIIFNKTPQAETIGFIKGQIRWCKLSDNVYCIRGDTKASLLRKGISQVEDKLNKFIVFHITDENELAWSSYNYSKEINNWLHGRT